MVTASKHGILRNLYLRKPFESSLEHFLYSHLGLEPSLDAVVTKILFHLEKRQFLSVAFV